jgi:hypothetical protein
MELTKRDLRKSYAVCTFVHTFWHKKHGQMSSRKDILFLYPFADALSIPLDMWSQ